MGGEARFACRERSMTEKESMIQGGGESNWKVEEGAHLQYGPNWIAIFLIGQMLLWQVVEKEALGQTYNIEI